jgi:hypothetical protein
MPTKLFMDKNTEPIPFKPSRKDVPDSEFREAFSSAAFALVKLGILAHEALKDYVNKRRSSSTPGELIEIDFSERKRKTP